MKAIDYLNMKGFGDIELFSDKGPFEITKKVSDIMDNYIRYRDESTYCVCEDPIKKEYPMYPGIHYCTKCEKEISN
ncbi:MAG: hypothetical protein GY928_14730 [Colwellia sp.]|nr:hypothetical protein [Colwellia sp.]